MASPFFIGESSRSERKFNGARRGMVYCSRRLGCGGVYVDVAYAVWAFTASMWTVTASIWTVKDAVWTVIASMLAV